MYTWAPPSGRQTYRSLKRFIDFPYRNKPTCPRPTPVLPSVERHAYQPPKRFLDFPDRNAPVPPRRVTPPGDRLTYRPGPRTPPQAAVCRFVKIIFRFSEPERAGACAWRRLATASRTDGVGARRQRRLQLLAAAAEQTQVVDARLRRGVQLDVLLGGATHRSDVLRPDGGHLGERRERRALPEQRLQQTRTSQIRGFQPFSDFSSDDPMTMSTLRSRPPTFLSVADLWV